VRLISSMERREVCDLVLQCLLSGFMSALKSLQRFCPVDHIQSRRILSLVSSSSRKDRFSPTLIASMSRLMSFRLSNSKRLRLCSMENSARGSWTLRSCLMSMSSKVSMVSSSKFK